MPRARRRFHSPPDTLARISQIGGDASSTIALAEAKRMVWITGASVSWKPQGCFSIQVKSSQNVLAARHGGGKSANVAYVDGHVDLSKAAALGFDVAANDWMPRTNAQWTDSPWRFYLYTRYR